MLWGEFEEWFEMDYGCLLALLEMGSTVNHVLSRRVWLIDQMGSLLLDNRYTVVERSILLLNSCSIHMSLGMSIAEEWFVSHPLAHLHSDPMFPIFSATRELVRSWFQNRKISYQYSRFENNITQPQICLCKNCSIPTIPPTTTTTPTTIPSKSLSPSKSIVTVAKLPNTNQNRPNFVYKNDVKKTNNAESKTSKPPKNEKSLRWLRERFAMAICSASINMLPDRWHEI